MCRVFIEVIAVQLIQHNNPGCHLLVHTDISSTTFLNSLFLNTLNKHSSLRVKDEVSHPHKPNYKIYRITVTYAIEDKVNFAFEDTMES